jgi:predicted peptidase
MIDRRKFLLFSGAGLLALKSTVKAQPQSGLKPKIFENAEGRKMPYRLFVPAKYEAKNVYPLAIWLHGVNGRGNDNMAQISEANRIGSHIWTFSENQAKNPCFVVAPQCADEEYWAAGDGYRPTEQLRLVLELLSDLRKTYSIDGQRMYVAGQSMGGIGTWAIITANPNLFAAAVPLCGGGNVADASKLTKMPIWAFHGDKDQSVPVDYSRKMIAAIRKAGGSPKYTEYKGAGHEIWERVFKEPELLPWVFSQRKG